MTEATTTSFDALRERRYVVLTTFRRSGVPVPTTVWLLDSGGKIYVTSPASTGKVTRLRNDPRVRLAPSDAKGTPLGPEVEGRARILDPVAGKAFDQTLTRRYGWQKRLLARFMVLRRKEQVILEISPA